MKKPLFLLMLIVAFSGKANAQGCQPTLSFSDYDSVWAVIGPNGYPQQTVYRSYQITGSAQMITEYCPGSQNAQHHEVLSTSIGSASYSLTTGNHCVSCSFNDSVETSLNMMPGNGPVSGNSTSSLVCSIRGSFFSTSKPKYFEHAETWDQAIGPGTYDGEADGEKIYLYNDIKAYCSNGTPDYNPSTLYVYSAHASTDTYFLSSATLYRLSTASTWSVLFSNGGYTNLSDSESPAPYNACTHTGPQK